MDKIDEAQALIENVTENRITRVRSRVGKTLLYSGFCYYCYERVHSPHIFCDLDCRDDYEREQRMNKIEGL
jgi:hypothetical protein